MGTLPGYRVLYWWESLIVKSSHPVVDSKWVPGAPRNPLKLPEVVTAGMQLAVTQWKPV